MSARVCKYPGCEEEATAGKFGSTYCDGHNEQVKAEKEAERAERKETTQREHKPASLTGIRGEIKDAVMMTAAVVAIKDPRIYIGVEATVDEFATAWANVAKTSPTAAKYIRGLLHGGVWVSAIGATVVMAVTVLAVTDSLPESLGALGHFCLGKAGIQMVPVAPNANGNGAGPEPALSEEEIQFGES